MSKGERRAWDSMLQGYKASSFLESSQRPWPTVIPLQAMVYPTGNRQITHLPPGRAERPVGHSASEELAKHSIEVGERSRKWSKRYGNVGPTLPPTHPHHCQCPLD